jgi:tetratricopeptide (TPR) repeat protein
MQARVLGNLVLLSIFAISSTTCPIALAAGGAAAKTSNTGADALYEAGKFGQAEQAYHGLIQPEVMAQTGFLSKLSRQLLGLARSQAAQNNFQEAAESFERALSIGQLANMPRSFIDDARSGLAEANGKLGVLGQVGNVGSQAMPAMPPPTVLQPHAPKHLHYSTIIPGIRTTTVSTVEADARLREYLRLCAVNYAEQVLGKNSSQAAQENLQLAEFYVEQGSSDQAAAPIEKAVEIIAKLSAIDQYLVGRSALDLATKLADSDSRLLSMLLAPSVLNVVGVDQPSAVDLSSKFSRIADSMQRKQDMTQAQTYEKYAVSLLEKSLPPGDLRLAKERMKLGALYEAAGKPGTAIEIYELAAPGLRDRSNDLQSVTVWTSLLTKYLQTDAKSKVEPAIAKLVAAIDQSDPSLAQSWFKPVLDVTALLVQDQWLPQVRQLYTHAFNRLSSTGEPFRQNIFFMTQSIKTLADRFDAVGHPDEAERLYVSFADCVKAGGTQTDSAADSAVELVRFYWNHDQVKKARSIIDSMIASMRKTGHSSPYYRRLSALVGELESRQRYDDALAIEDALLSVFDEDSASLADSVANYTRAARLFQLTGDHARSAGLDRKAMATVLKYWPSDLADLNASVSRLIENQITEGKMTEAGNLLSTLAQREQYVRNYPTSASAAWLNSLSYSLSVAFEQEKMFAPAIELNKKRIDADSKQFGPSSIQAAGAIDNLARIIRSSGDTQKADKFEEQSVAIRGMYARQTTGDTQAYQPFRSLEETMKAWQIYKLKPADST